MDRLWRACRIGDLSAVKQFPPDVLHRRVKGQTLVYIASKYGNLELLHWLSEQEVDLSICNERNITPFSAAIKHGHLMTAHFLYMKGVDINAADINLNTPFLYACMRGHKDCAQWLHQVGVDIAGVNRDNEDALVLACRYANLRLADWLVSVHSFPPQRYMDVMHAACVLGQLSVAKWVIARGKQYLHNTRSPPLYHACKNSNLVVAKWLVQEGAAIEVTKDGETPFYAATTVCDMETMVWLHSIGASITTPDAEGITPLRRVCTMRLYNDRFYFYYYAVWLILNGAVSDSQGHVSKAALLEQVGSGRALIRHHIERLLEESSRHVRMLWRVRVKLNLVADIVAYIADFVGVVRGRNLRNARQTLVYI